MPRWEAGLAQTGESSWVHPSGSGGARWWDQLGAGGAVLFCLVYLRAVGSSVRPRGATVQQDFLLCTSCPAAACTSWSLHALCNTPSWWRSPFHVKLSRGGWPLPELVRATDAVRRDCWDDILISVTPGRTRKTSVISELYSRTVIQILLTYLVLRSETDKPKKTASRVDLEPCLG